MITIFSNPRSFTGRFKILQYNAIRSWKYLHPDVQIILFEDEEGTTKKVAQELSVQYVNGMPVNEFGTPLIDGVFNHVQEHANHEIVVQVNADIILTQSFISSVNRLNNIVNGNPFLMIGRRWDLDVTTLIEYDDNGEWEDRIINQVKEEGSLHRMSGMDYWIFRRDSQLNPPSFVVGRTGFDGWLIKNARYNKVPVIDATESITIIHQNHDYPQQRNDYYFIEKERNFKLGGSYWSVFSLWDADYLLVEKGLKRPPYPRRFYSLFSTNPVWRFFLATYLFIRKTLKI